MNLSGVKDKEVRVLTNTKPVTVKEPRSFINQILMYSSADGS